jgi:hypothetical protein
MFVICYRNFLIFFSSACPHCDDGTMTEDSPLTRWSCRLNDAMRVSGRVPATEELLRERLEKAGFVDVKSFTLRMPIGPWAKDKYKPRTSDTLKTSPAHFWV